METIQARWDAARASNQAAVLCTVVARRGSAPRGPGAVMLLAGDGFSGTIGGGKVEFEAQEEARRVLTRGAFTKKTYRLTNETAADLGMVCGGEVEVYFTYFAPGALPDLSAGGFLLLGADGTAQVSATGAPGLHQECFTLPLSRRGTVYLFGGGHVAKALCEALSRVAFPVVVLEDRPEFLTPDRFPDAKDRRLVDFSDLSGLTLSKEDLVVVMTRGHQSDFAVLRQVLPTPAGYVGCMGSRAKVAITRQRLLDAGIPLARVDSLKSPIGLPIGAETPEEIAVSITAQLIAHRAGL